MCKSVDTINGDLHCLAQRVWDTTRLSHHEDMAFGVLLKVVTHMGRIHQDGYQSITLSQKQVPSQYTRDLNLV